MCLFFGLECWLNLSKGINATKYQSTCTQVLHFITVQTNILKLLTFIFVSNCYSFLCILRTCSNKMTPPKSNYKCYVKMLLTFMLHIIHFADGVKRSKVSSLYKMKMLLSAVHMLNSGCTQRYNYQQHCETLTKYSML